MCNNPQYYPITKISKLADETFLWFGTEPVEDSIRRRVRKTPFFFYDLHVKTTPFQMGKFIANQGNMFDPGLLFAEDKPTRKLRKSFFAFWKWKNAVSRGKRGIPLLVGLLMEGWPLQRLVLEKKGDTLRMRIRT